MADAAFPRRIIQFDLALCALFAAPGLSGLVLDLIEALNRAIGLPGTLSPIEGSALFFVNFAGVLGVLLNYVLLRSRDKRSHWANIIARGGVVLLISFYMGAGHLPPVFAMFVVTEMAGGLATLPWLWGTRQQPEQPHRAI